MKMLKSRATAILITVLLTFSMTASTMLLPGASAQTQNFPTYSYVRVSPNPVGVDQQVTVDFGLAVPLENVAFATNMTIVVTHPNGNKETLGPFISDYTGSTSTRYTPTTVGNYTFQFFYGGQVLGIGETGPGFVGDVELPSHSVPVTLVVQSSPVSYQPTTPLPTSYWQTPINAENVQNWAAISGPWLGLASNPFGSTGAYNVTGNDNPYTLGPTSAHILWTKPWAVGGVAGGQVGNDELSSYWGTSQYEPKWNPVVIDGIEYSDWYTTTTSSDNGLVATNLYNGQTMWTISTTNPLIGGMVIKWESVNQYGVVGPYILTSGTLPGVNDALVPSIFGGLAPAGEYNLYDALTGTYVASIVNGTTPGSGFSGGFMTNDANGNWVGYYVNSTFGTEVVHPAFGVNKLVNITQPALTAWNMTDALLEYGNQLVGSGWSPSGVYNFADGIMWANPSVPDMYNGNPLGFVNPLTNLGGLNGGGLSEGQLAGNVIVLTYGIGAGINGATAVGETPGWAIEAGFSLTDGSLLWIKNQTETPFTRISENFYNLAGDGIYVEDNMATNVAIGYSLNTGKQVWQKTLTVNGATANTYDVYGIQDIVDPTIGVIYLWGLGGDIWAVNMTNGNIIWATTTTDLQGSSGYETPYAVWPLWVQFGGVMAGGNNVLYLSEGHEYSPPLFHGAQELAINATNGKLLWKILGFDDTGAEVSYGILTTFNAYDNQVYAYGKGPSKTTVTAANPATTVGSPTVITGTVTDVSAGASQEAVAANFPNGLPAVSDASESQFMEAVYMQQPMPTNLTGVPVTISVLDSNGNNRVIGTTKSNGNGFFTLTWMPDIPGNFTVTATFAGTNSYYGSSANTAFYASSPPATPAPTAAPPTGLASTSSLELGIAAVIIVIIIIGAILAVIMLRKKP